MSDAALAISNLVYRYAELIDLGQFDALGELFRHAVITTDMSDEVRQGAEAMASQMHEWTRRYPDGTPRTKHMTTNLIIELGADGTTARARSYYMVFQQTDALPLQPIIGGRYHDEFAIIDGEWAFTKRHYINELFGDLSAHLLRPVE
jgi:3-phenylpropionate/cinnamic acid dioxygenase small subunit